MGVKRRARRLAAGMAHNGSALPLAVAAHPAAVGLDTRTVVLVEGVSDQAAVEALAERLGRSLVAEGITVVPMGGAMGIRTFLERYGPPGYDLRLAGLCDVGEESIFRRGLEQTGFGAVPSRDALEALGFYVCDKDLEDELIRALGVARVELVIETEGELGSFRTLQKQAAHQGRRPEAQLRRFMGSGSGRKIRYGRLLVDALELSEMPRPLDRLLAHL